MRTGRFSTFEGTSLEGDSQEADPRSKADTASQADKPRRQTLLSTEWQINVCGSKKKNKQPNLGSENVTRWLIGTWAIQKCKQCKENILLSFLQSMNLIAKGSHIQKLPAISPPPPPHTHTNAQHFVFLRDLTEFLRSCRYPVTWSKMVHRATFRSRHEAINGWRQNVTHHLSEFRCQGHSNRWLVNGTDGYH